LVFLMKLYRTPRIRDNYATCLMCTNHHRPEYNKLANEVFICYPCADKIANIYNMVHSGFWLNWPNEKKQTKKKHKISNTLRKSVFERDMYRCVSCSTHLELCCDHIHPESKGGLTVYENLQTLCRSCNSKKGTSIK